MSSCDNSVHDDQGSQSGRGEGHGLRSDELLVFLTTGLMSPFVSSLMTPSSDAPLSLHEFQEGLLPLIVGILLAIVLSFVIRETGTDKQSAERHGATAPFAGNVQ